MHRTIRTAHHDDRAWWTTRHRHELLEGLIQPLVGIQLVLRGRRVAAGCQCGRQHHSANEEDTKRATGGHGAIIAVRSRRDVATADPAAMMP